MLFLSNFFNFNSLAKLEKQAKVVLDLQKDIKAFRLEKEVVVVEKNKITQRFKDVFPTNPKRACIEISKCLKLSSAEQINNLVNKKSDVWTCGFREDEERWVWYQGSEPKMTVSFEETNLKKKSLEDKVFFFSARYGTSIITRIKNSNLEKVSKEINGFVLENPYVRVSCTHCEHEENYTIDDIVDIDKKSSYTSNFVVCQHCNELIKLT